MPYLSLVFRLSLILLICARNDHFATKSARVETLPATITAPLHSLLVVVCTVDSESDKPVMHHAPERTAEVLFFDAANDTDNSFAVKIISPRPAWFSLDECVHLPTLHRGLKRQMQK